MSVTRLGQELAIRKGGSNHEKRVAFVHQVPAWLGTEKAERPGHKRQVVWYSGFTKQRLGNPGIETVGNGDHLIGSVQRAGADKHRNLGSLVEDFRRLF